MGLFFGLATALAAKRTTKRVDAAAEAFLSSECPVTKFRVRAA
jgi:hypothetical protein